ncbi:acyl carrier protein [Streptomyces radicis]|uniref:Acyl carrier protein n=1 Tax=Streptomyces radicis TaxID=1750517 RepID=A0A3A9WFI7_9ACTN|nr:acyl carrier protein [Streptomyces radicis]RKN11550.1 acyl carrier protein [Streptomyces radicis]RKN26432.1 acyl carrier protein [Streptomyces radicis]
MSALSLDSLLETINRCLGDDEEAVVGPDAVDTDFDDLGLDSLTVLETLNQIERQLGLKVPEELLAEVRTPGALLTLVNDRAAAPDAATGAG